MVRSLWQGAVVVMLGWSGLAWGQQAPTAPPKDTISVYENGKELRCRVITRWQTATAQRAMQLQVIATGEILTLEQDGPGTPVQGRSGKMQALSMKIYHWGNLRTPPPGSPVPPPGVASRGNQQPIITVAATENAEPAIAQPFCDTCDAAAAGRTRRVGGNGDTGFLGKIFPWGRARNGSGDGIVTADMIAPDGSRPTLITVSSSDSPMCNTCTTSPSATTQQAGCGCGAAAYAKAPVPTGSPYAPLAAGISSRTTGDVPTTVSVTPQKMPSDASAAAGPTGPAISQPNVGQAIPLPTQTGAGTAIGSASPPASTGSDVPPVPVPSASPPAVTSDPGVPATPAPPAALPLAPNSAVPVGVPGETIVPAQPASTPVSTPVSPSASPYVSSPAASTFPQPSTDPAKVTSVDQGTIVEVKEKKRDWHNMWGSSLFAKTKQPGQTLVDPTPIGKGPALPREETLSAKAAAAKQSDPLLNPERYQPQVVEKKMERAGVYIPRPAQDSAVVGGPALPQGTISVLAAQNGAVRPVQFVPVPVPTVPQPWRAPLPPPPEMPNAPSPAAYVNAFTQPKPQTPPPQTPPPGGAFTAPPNGGPSAPAAYGPMPYGPMQYGPMPYGPMQYGPMQHNPAGDPRMMMAYGPMAPPMAPQGAYGPAYPYQPPALSTSLPAYAYQQMAQGLPPQRPIAQINYPSTYAGPTPPSLVPAQPMMPYVPPMPIYANPAMDRPGMPVAPPAANVTPVSFNSSPVLRTLRESLYPAERETAVITLSNQDLRNQPEAVQALCTAARQDPAGMVRAACVRCLARQQLNNQQVVNLLNDLKADSDPRVRLEVEQVVGQVRR